MFGNAFLGSLLRLIPETHRPHCYRSPPHGPGFASSLLGWWDGSYWCSVRQDIESPGRQTSWLDCEFLDCVHWGGKVHLTVGDTISCISVLGWINTASELSISIYHSLLPDCCCDANSCLRVLLLGLPHHDKLSAWTVSQKKPSLSFNCICKGLQHRGQLTSTSGPW